MKNNSILKGQETHQYTMHGREIDIPDTVVTHILEKMFPKNRFLPERFTETENINRRCGTCFKVDLSTIDISLFQKIRADTTEEELRLLILEAYTEAQKEPEKYATPFFILLPCEDWYATRNRSRYSHHANISDIKDFAKKIDGSISNWIDIYLGFAQEISHNSNAWSYLCKQIDYLPEKFMLWKNGSYRMIGGSFDDRDYCTRNTLAELGSELLIENLNLIREIVPFITLKKLDCPIQFYFREDEYLEMFAK